MYDELKNVDITGFRKSAVTTIILTARRTLAVLLQ